MSDATHMRVARLEVICGPMFSGKTTELIRRILAARERLGDSGAVAIRPKKDTRYGGEGLATHNGVQLPATGVADAAGVLGVAGDARVVGIDEAHFFGAELVEPCSRLLAKGATVIVSGVERDHNGLPFEPFPRLLCEADEVVKLSGPCAGCGGASFISHRKAASRERIVVGGAEMYEPLCRACFAARKS